MFFFLIQKNEYNAAFEGYVFILSLIIGAFDYIPRFKVVKGNLHVESCLQRFQSQGFQVFLLYVGLVCY